MDNRYFNILGHATGRLLLKRPGYEIDIDRVIDQARKNGCFFEINASPDRLDLSAENARRAAAAGRHDRYQYGCPRHRRIAAYPVRHRSGPACGPGKICSA